MIQETIGMISSGRIRENLFHLSKDPLPFRKANYTRPGESQSSLEETDTFIKGHLASDGLDVRTSLHRVQAFQFCKSHTYPDRERQRLR